MADGTILLCRSFLLPYKYDWLILTSLFHPSLSTPGNVFDAKSVSLLCCPRGLSFTTDRVYSPTVSPKPQDKDFTSFHTFLVTREDGSRIFGSAYTFYEVWDHPDGTLNISVSSLFSSSTLPDFRFSSSSSSSFLSLFLTSAFLSRLLLLPLLLLFLFSRAVDGKINKQTNKQTRYRTELVTTYGQTRFTGSFVPIHRKCESGRYARPCRRFTPCTWPSWRTRRARRFTTISILLRNARRRPRWVDEVGDPAAPMRLVPPRPAPPRPPRYPPRFRRPHRPLISTPGTLKRISTTWGNF